MTEDTLTLLFYALAAFFVLRGLMQWFSQSEDDKVDVQVVFPVELRYNDYQWYGWDHDGEFLGQAPTKDELMNQIAKEIDLPLDKFKIMSELKIVQPAK